MTDEDVLQNFLDDCLRCRQRKTCEELEKSGGSPCRNSNAISALRERIERRHGCDTCKKPTGTCSLCMNRGIYNACEDGMIEPCEYLLKMNFYPSCGKKLGENAHE